MQKWSIFIAITSLACLVASARAQIDNSSQVFQLTSEEFKQKIDNGDFGAIIDVRTAIEFAEGHIANATLLENLASYGTSDQVATPDDLMGCELCDLGVYCRSGSRAATAITILQQAGFQGRLYNGLGVSQWSVKGYPLVNDTVSTPALCAVTTDAGDTQKLLLRYLASNNNSTPATYYCSNPTSPVMPPTAEASNPTSGDITKQFVLGTMLTGLVAVLCN